MSRLRVGVRLRTSLRSRPCRAGRARGLRRAPPARARPARRRAAAARVARIVLRRLQRSLPREARILAPALDSTVDEIGPAVADLRQIAHGLRPTRLDDGLRRRSPTWRARADPGRRRREPEPLPAEVEAAAYFVACEAITNAVKHAAAVARPRDARPRDGRVQLAIADDGGGGAASRPGPASPGSRDRVEAQGGALAIESPAGGGTRGSRWSCRADRDRRGHRAPPRGPRPPARGRRARGRRRVGDAEALLAAVAEHEPDLAIIDVRMPPTTTTRACAPPPRSAAHPAPPCSSSRSTSRRATRRAGLRRRRLRLPAEGPRARRRRLPRRRSPRRRGRLGARPGGRCHLLAHAPEDSALDELTPREREVLALMAEGRTNAAIAKRLWLTERTVETHVRAILGKLGLPTGGTITAASSRC